MKRTLTGLMLCLVAVAPGLASGPSETADAGIPGEHSFQPTVVLRCTVVAVRGEGQLVVLDKETGEQHILVVSDEVSVKARNKKEFGRKKLVFSDFAVGQNLRVTLEASTRRPLRIRVWT